VVYELFPGNWKAKAFLPCSYGKDAFAKCKSLARL